ncbi:hypothetical protein ANOM_010568 [Aspergillus nomiae NRRL 13137]|uniref:ABM domain-containing protein n=1 Tax=Aspergillus nomiae NRRL (strain ATCC 15546 / NRRL 13137 / CBS 260.88 / M93) TaxID=1509407 RepID=A0A0L1IMW0_ASPN3|nr:uncharacterized protein ANOM_010568 [Aspergillus nomiae NRRL 13137]KNG80919.1 hypothetical protein ANOM_010568 [Aspergillus nomiae NRRL 13137]
MPSEAIHNIVTLVPQDGKLTDLIQAFNKLSQYVQIHEPETLLYYAVQPKGKDQLLRIMDSDVNRERYASEHALKSHAQSVAFKEFGKAITDILQTPPDIKTSTFTGGFEARSRI